MNEESINPSTSKALIHQQSILLFIVLLLWCLQDRLYSFTIIVYEGSQ